MRKLATLPLIGRDDLGAGYQVLRFGADEPIEAEPGHFAMVRGESWGLAPLLPRPMSLLSAGAEPSMLIKVVGEGTRRMAQAAIGERFSIHAPLGTPWRMPAEDQQPVLVAGGVGVAPLVYLAKVLAERGHRKDGAHPAVLTLYGGRTERDLPLAEQLSETSKLEVSTDDGSRGCHGRVTVLLERLLAEAKRDGRKLKLYTCGPHVMMGAVAKLAADADVPCDASLEAPMGCGYGVCLGCPVTKSDGGYLYTCVDGPCVDASRVNWSQRVFG
jgi:dihydroorotate dehydrogenase electron transfer subunit